MSSQLSFLYRCPQLSRAFSLLEVLFVIVIFNLALLVLAESEIKNIRKNNQTSTQAHQQMQKESSDGLRDHS